MSDEPKVYVQVEENEYKQLLKDSAMLSYLHAGGVDNWDWYDESLEPFYEEYPD